MARPRGRPKGKEQTEVIGVRLPKTLLADLDRYLDLLESRVGLKANRSSVAKHAIEVYLQERLPEALGSSRLNEGKKQG
jgi:metal-responsive CopG/Arc/MetJ family transcriptional regulator